MTATSSALVPYLRRLGVDGRPSATLETLVDLHRRHLATVPYENLEIMLGRPPAVDPAVSLARIGETGRAGYCFHQNGALEVALRELGFEVTRRHGHVWTADEHRSGTDLNHLVLMVTGLPTPDNPGGRWWPDVGLGEGVGDPLPLVPGSYGEGALAVAIETVDEDGWSYRHHGSGSFRGVEVRDLPIDAAAVQIAHTRLSTPPDGQFTGVLVVQHKDGEYVDTLRCCVLSRVGPDGHTETDVTSYADWRAALTDVVALPVDDVPDEELRALWERMRAAHEKWDAAGRP
jgi:N-hydroxyarylamine O-acetyltransferase